MSTETEVLLTERNDLLESAWGIIANAYGGDWNLASETSGWKKAAEKWREKYFAQMDSKDYEDNKTPEHPLIPNDKSSC